jgi:membrane protease YdiL (CAAX protease family)
LGRQIWRLVGGDGLQFKPAFTDSRVLFTFALEVGMAALLLAWLSQRGWNVRSQIGAPALGDLVRGAGLWLALFATGQLVRLGLYLGAPDLLVTTQSAPLTGTLSPWTLGAALLINPIFEEGLFLGYAVPTLERAIGLGAAVTVSIALRVLVHWNQGVHALVSVVPFALLLTAYFVWTRRLWPVVVAHVANNAIGLGAFVSSSS